MCYGMMYAARNVTGKQLGSLFPEVYEEEDSGEEEGSEEDEVETNWSRYNGTDNEHALNMNACADSWDAWEPETPAERALKNAVNKAKEEYV
jgi:hypothetical protein